MHSQPALHKKVKDENGVLPKDWTVWTWQEYYNDCTRFAKSLVKLDVDLHKIVNILGFNSPEWFISNVGTILAGSIAAGIYPSTFADGCFYVSDHSNAEVITTDDNKQLYKYIEVLKKNKLPHLKCFVVWDVDVDPKAIKELKKMGKAVYTWDAFMALGDDVDDEDVKDRADSIEPGHCSSLIYTSGTTGPPKAVMISHDNVTWTTRCVFETVMECNHEDRIVSFLPLSHIAAQVMDMHGPMHIGAKTFFAQTDAMKGTLKDTLIDCEPTIFFGVPRVWEKFAEGMRKVASTKPAIVQGISGMCKKIALEKQRNAQYGEDGSIPCGYSCASAFLGLVKKAIGLHKVKACFTAAAPIAKEILEYFASLNIPVYEVFGQSECTGPHTVSCAQAWKIGSCGRPMKGTETKIGPGGELCYNGRHIFMGYMYNKEKTMETFDKDGFLRSGDIATFDEDEDEDIPRGPSGFMRITGRIKELIITAGGENVAPVIIEDEMKKSMPAISNCVVIGDKMKFLSMFITLRSFTKPDGQEVLDSLATVEVPGSNATTVAEALVCPAWKKYLEDGIKDANNRAISNAQKINKYRVLPCDFTEAGGELTPTLKLKRNEVAKKYAAEIDAFYN
jgi:long-chain-fatty-acid--CoA ligase ACSBG